MALPSSRLGPRPLDLPELKPKARGPYGLGKFATCRDPRSGREECRGRALAADYPRTRWGSGIRASEPIAVAGLSLLAEPDRVELLVEEVTRRDGPAAHL